MNSAGLKCVVLICSLIVPLMSSVEDSRAQPCDTLLAREGEMDGDVFGVTVSGAGDFDGNGFDDVIIGAPHNSAADTSAGRVYIYGGGANVGSIPSFVFTGVAKRDHFGASVSNAGDVNGDGFADVIVGSPYCEAGGVDAGSAYVYYGGPSADAVADFVLTGEMAGAHLGLSVSGGGDINGDGFADLMVGASYSGDAGRVHVYYGGAVPDTIADLVLIGEASGDSFGRSVSDAGDFNGDGFSDVLVGADGNDANGSGSGRAYVFYGGPNPDSILDLALTGEGAWDFFGKVSRAGDFNGDGYDDIIVGASGQSSAYVYWGGPAPNSTPDFVFVGETAADAFGNSVSAAGDVNGDAFEDIIVGAQQAGISDPGKVYVYYGGPYADSFADLVLTGGRNWDWFGYSVSGAGDVNGDGRADIVVGSAFPIVIPPEDRPSDCGRAYVFSCSPGATPVYLAEFVARTEGRAILLTWTTTSDQEVVGFHVYRSTNPVDGYQVLSKKLITALSSYGFLDTSASVGIEYFYRLEALDRSGGRKFFGPVSARIEAEGHRPTLGKSFPNPSRGVITIPFTLAKPANVRVRILDHSGSQVRMLIDSTIGEGDHSLIWDGGNDQGQTVPAGIYFYQLQTAWFEVSRRLVKLR